MAKQSKNKRLTKATMLRKKTEVAQPIEIHHEKKSPFPGKANAKHGLNRIQKSQNNRPIHPSQEEFNQLASLNNQNNISGLINLTNKLILRYPESYILWNILGMSLAKAQRLDKSINAFQNVIFLAPNYPDAYNNLGNIFREKGNYTKALAYYDKAISLRPHYTEALTNICVVLREQGDHIRAIDGLRKILSKSPNHANALNTAGSILKDLGKPNEAIKMSRRALAINPRFPEAYVNLAGALSDIEQYPNAILAYENAIKYRPNDAASKAQVLLLKRKICDWTTLEACDDSCQHLGINTQPVPPFGMLCLEDNPERQRLRSRKIVSELYKHDSRMVTRKKRSNHRRLRIGYLASTFHNHALMYLMSGIFREHNSDEFEIFCYSYGETKSGSYREALKKDVEHFIDIASFSYEEIFDLVRSNEIDIAIDLNGYTKNTRSDIFQMRLAPLQINFLGYPGTLGAKFFDFLIADSRVISQSQRSFYDERIIYMPHSYMPNDNLRCISKTLTRRVDFGLGSENVVLCCFNGSQKISTEEFTIWMRILDRCDHCVLWLMKSNAWAENNLRKEASKLGVDPSRIIFSEHMEHDKHLERLRHADLFIDTFCYNAHTTASDALWAGVPLVTKCGRQFAARVATSLLHAVDLPELVVDNNAAYEALIIDLVTHPEKLASIRRKLSAHRLTQPLFDTTRYTRNLEEGFKTIFRDYENGKKPKDVWVQDCLS